MNKPLTATQKLNQRFLKSLLLIGLIIGLTEFLIMNILDFYLQSGGSLDPAQETILDTLFLTLISSPLLWFIVLRPLVVSIVREQEKVMEQDRQNKELRIALDAHALVSITDKTGRIIYANEKFSQVSGYSRDELLGQDHRIINSGFHSKAFFKDLWQNITQGKTWQGIICNKNKDGGNYWVDSTIMPLLDENGLPKQYISIRRDISEQKAAENHLKTLRRALDACGEMVIITDSVGTIQYANPALYQFTGWTNESLIGRNVSILNSTSNDTILLASMKQKLEEKDSWSGRLLSRRKGIAPVSIAGQSLPPDPLEFWSESNITPVLNDDGSLFGYVQIMRDITDLVADEVRQELEKEDSAARFKIAETLQSNAPLKERFEAILNVLFRLNALNIQCKGGVFLKSENENILEMFVLQGKFSDEFIQKEQRVAFGDCLCGRAAKANELLISDDCFCDPRHEHSFTNMQAHGHFIVPLAVGEVVLGVMFLYTDPYPSHHEERLSMLKQVGEMMALAILRDRTQSALENARDLAMQASKSKSEFLANVSHEIRTPMNGVLGMLELLTDTSLSNTQSELVETAHNSAESLLEILNDLLDYSKLEAGKIEVEKVSFNLGAIIEEVSTLLSRRAFAKGLELNCFLPSDLHSRWLGDPMRIRQVITNLIGNAIKFTEKGEIDVILKLVGKVDDIHSFRFEIRDTGIGILPKVQASLFQPFTQAEAATARRYGGTGLGLSICKGLVSLMGGEIGLESEIDKGSCFWFVLPLMFDHHQDTEATVNFENKRVLVVDDNATNRMILEHYMNHWGLAVTLVENGQVALSELAKAEKLSQTYDLIILDMHMPVMDGKALIRKLQESISFDQIPRILLSSGAVLEGEEFNALGLKCSLMKPVRQSQLFHAISNILIPSENEHLPNTKTTFEFPDYSGKKILVVEDNKVNQKVLLGSLAKFNINPTVADNGQIAIDLLTKGDTFDLIFMDCQMPVLDGYQTTSAIRNLEQKNGISRQVIIALTAHAITGEREKCLSNGMDDYLSKPVKRHQLLNTLANWLASSDFSEVDSVLENSQNLAKNDSIAIWDENLTLKNIEGDKELLLDMITSFLEETPTLTKQLENVADDKNLSELANIAHAIKGSVSNFNATTVTEIAANIERLARENKELDYKMLTNNLISLTNQLIFQLDHYLNNKI